MEYIENDNRLKYESCRDSWQQEIAIKERLQREKEDTDCELLKFQSECDRLWEELGIQYKLNTALLAKIQRSSGKKYSEPIKGNITSANASSN